MNFPYLSFPIEEFAVDASKDIRFACELRNDNAPVNTTCHSDDQREEESEDINVYVFRFFADAQNDTLGLYTRFANPHERPEPEKTILLRKALKSLFQNA